MVVEFIDFITEQQKKIYTVIGVLIVCSVIYGVSSLFSRSYFTQIESVQGVEEATLFNTSISVIEESLGSMRQESYGDVKKDDNIEGNIDGTEFKGSFKYYIKGNGLAFSSNKQDVLVVKIEKYLSSKTYKVPEEKIKFSPRK